MSHGTDATVECPLCGTAFDPSVSGGWCTDSECGAWRHDGATDSHRRLVTDGGTTEREHGEDSQEEKPDVAEVWPDDEGDSADDGPESTADEGDSVDDGPESTADEGDSADDGPDSADDEGDSASTADEGDAGGDDRASESLDGGGDDGTIACPTCETEIDVEDNFCRACGADVSGIDDSGRLASCPSCETDVEPEDSFCRECGEHLDAHRPGTDDSAPTGAGRSGSAGGQQAESPETAPADGQRNAAGAGASAGAGQASAANAETVKGGGSAAEASAAAGGAADEPDDDEPRLSLVARNREVTVGDGDVVGKEIRSIIMDTGGDEEDAVRVHREHVRFEHEDGQFYVVALGKNPTVVNGEELEQGDRAPVEPGDRIDLSGVARIGVRQG